jgi:hypothetical protein
VLLDLLGKMDLVILEILMKYCSIKRLKTHNFACSKSLVMQIHVEREYAKIVTVVFLNVLIFKFHYCIIYLVALINTVSKMSEVAYRSSDTAQTLLVFLTPCPSDEFSK